MSNTKQATDVDSRTDRKDRSKPTMRERVCYQPVEAHGVTDLDYTKDQTNRCHEEAKDPETTAQGAILPGEDGVDNAKWRFQAIHKRRKQTEKVFDALRPTVAGTRKRLGR